MNDMEGTLGATQQLDTGMLETALTPNQTYREGDPRLIKSSGRGYQAVADTT